MSGIVNVIIGCVVYKLEVSANNEEDKTVAVEKKSFLHLNCKIEERKLHRCMPHKSCVLVS